MSCEFRLPCGICNNANCEFFGKQCNMNSKSNTLKQREVSDKPMLGHEPFDFDSESKNKTVTADELFKYDDFVRNNQTKNF